MPERTSTGRSFSMAWRTRPPTRPGSLRRGEERLNFFPGPVALGSALPLSGPELAELYSTNETVSADDEAELGSPLPHVEQLPSPEEFENLVTERKRLAGQEPTSRDDLWA